MKIKSTKLLFLYRTFFFKKVRFETDNKELKNIVTALNIKNKKDRISYVYDEAVKYINKYYSKDLCQFIDGKCIVQRKNNIDRVNGCCFRCPLVTDTGCPSSNLMCKLIYCKTSLNNMKTLKFNDIKILKCLKIKSRIILCSSFMLKKEDILDDMSVGYLRWLYRCIFIRKRLI